MAAHLRAACTRKRLAFTRKCRYANKRERRTAGNLEFVRSP